MIAALFVETNGCYFGIPNVDPWDKQRDARKYPGSYRVIAHPPCSRWCRMAPVNEARYGQTIGDDDGCFESALASVRKYGGLLEHPAYSLAWPAFNIPRPFECGGWVKGFCGGWSAHIEQRNYGHRARKGTWIYAYGIEPPINVKWGSGDPPEAWISTDRPRSELSARGIGQLSKKEASSTPDKFRDLLISMVSQ